MVPGPLPTYGLRRQVHPKAAMTPQKISRASLVVVFASLTMVAGAQTPGQDRDDPIYETPVGHASEPPLMARGENAERSTIAPTNVLDDVPPEVSGKSPLSCNDDPGVAQISATCRRWLQIAGGSE